MKALQKIHALFREWSKAVIASLLTIAFLLSAYFIVSAAFVGSNVSTTNTYWSPGEPPQTTPELGNVASVWVTKPELAKTMGRIDNTYHIGNVNINSNNERLSATNPNDVALNLTGAKNVALNLTSANQATLELKTTNKDAPVIMDFTNAVSGFDYGARIVYKRIPKTTAGDHGVLKIATDKVIFADNASKNSLGVSEYSNGKTLEINNSDWKVNVSGDVNVGLDAGGGGGNITAKGTITAPTITQTSDSRLKKDLRPIQNALAKVLQLNGVNFYWKDKNQDQGLQMGVIAQEVEKVFPELVKTDKEGMKSVAYANLVGALIEAIKEQQKTITEQGASIRELREQVLNLEEQG